MRRKVVIALGCLALALPLVVVALIVSRAARPSLAAPGAPNPASGGRLTYLALYADPFANGPVRKSFSASSDNVLYVQTQWLDLVGDLHDAYFTYTSPDGAVYQVQDVPFSIGPAPANGQPQTLRRPGVLHPLTVQAARSTGPGGYAVWGQLPLAGTWVGRLPGQWQLTVRLDGNPDTLGTQTFRLTP